jgi:nitric-oxide synthase
VKLVDHHTASDDFMQFVGMEQAAGRCVHMRWSWITPPVGGSTTPVFHLDEDHFPDITLKPNFFYQKPAYAREAGGGDAAILSWCIREDVVPLQPWCA